jgi:hypothetical protein
MRSPFLWLWFGNGYHYHSHVISGIITILRKPRTRLIMFYTYGSVNNTP